MHVLRPDQDAYNVTNAQATLDGVASGVVDERKGRIAVLVVDMSAVSIILDPLLVLVPGVRPGQHYSVRVLVSREIVVRLGAAADLKDAAGHFGSRREGVTRLEVVEDVGIIGLDLPVLVIAAVVVGPEEQVGAIPDSVMNRCQEEVGVAQPADPPEPVPCILGQRPQHRLVGRSRVVCRQRHLH